MPLFYFHLRTPTGLDPDEDGLTMPNIETAYLEACASIPDMAIDLIREGLSPMPYAFVITNEAGEILMEIPFAERLRDPQRQIRPKQTTRARRLSQEIADAIGAARATTQRSREILARARGTS
ncbi:MULTISPECIES: hypothetical protein [unclassified Methylobacterium]|uniref:DUF6894 family protein n=2 Tax=Methylobacterium TaxID=407 RepID=UPI0011C1E410|nr:MULTISPECIES: hypothetical protein [unclassified Methylobacterium]QEE41200.1 hypothetical protein FVA80_21730 [Methylobacterium sp. WL1]TXN00587.1 hypothetical protein FV242_21585 [Methylobacterium sp. WL64]TXN54012.1 hypothetical protein FV241_25815 [Methylobacterium sp. WL2]